jgi:hypothetical protein
MEVFELTAFLHMLQSTWTGINEPQQYRLLATIHRLLPHFNSRPADLDKCYVTFARYNFKIKQTCNYITEACVSL